LAIWHSVIWDQSYDLKIFSINSLAKQFAFLHKMLLVCAKKRQFFRRKLAVVTLTPGSRNKNEAREDEIELNYG
jgi:hypothetical protein